MADSTGREIKTIAMPTWAAGGRRRADPLCRAVARMARRGQVSEYRSARRAHRIRIGTHRACAAGVIGKEVIYYIVATP